MAIVSMDQLIASAKQDNILIVKTATRTSVAAIPFSMFDIAGSPSGTLAVGNTANGLVHTDATAGYPEIVAFGGGATGYIHQIAFANTVASYCQIFDRLFSAGAYSFNSNVTLASQPSYAGRVPGANYSGLEIWIEAVTAFTGTPSVAITYTNQAGTTARSTGTISLGAALTVGRMFRMPLQSGDTGVQKIESVVATVATVGTFNVHVMRRIGPMLRVKIANDAVFADGFQMAWPIVYDTSALFPVIWADSTSTGLPSINMQIING